MVSLKSHAANAPVNNVFYSPDGARVISSAAGERSAYRAIHDVTKDPPVVVDELNFRATDISPDGRLLACGWENEITVWDIAERKVVWQQPCHAGHSSTSNSRRMGNSSFPPADRTGWLSLGTSPTRMYKSSPFRIDEGGRHRQI